jgi:tellurite methyltransferase
MTSSAERWDAIYASVREPGAPGDFVLDWERFLPEVGTAVDLAGGSGGTARWLASRGLAVTLVDGSARALATAGEAAGVRGLELSLQRRDLEEEGPPEGRWDLVVVSNFLHRPLLGELARLLVPGGLALVRIATVRNLERNQHPSRRFLVEEGELHSLCTGLAVVEYQEGWFGGRHEARLAARHITTPTPQSKFGRRGPVSGPR